MTADALNRLLDDACYSIVVKNSGAVVYQSACRREWEQAGGDFEQLLTLIADHIYVDDDNDGNESIDWNAVQKEYRDFQSKQKQEESNARKPI